MFKYTMSDQLKQAAINKLSFAAVGRWKTIERVFLGSIYLMKSLDMKLKAKTRLSYNDPQKGKKISQAQKVGMGHFQGRP